jgi:hypothetical protein
MCSIAEAAAATGTYLYLCNPVTARVMKTNLSTQPASPSCALLSNPRAPLSCRVPQAMTLTQTLTLVGACSQSPPGPGNTQNYMRTPPGTCTQQQHPHLQHHQLSSRSLGAVPRSPSSPNKRPKLSRYLPQSAL